MAIFRLQSKLFAGTAGIIGAAQSISAGTGDNVNTGIKTAQENLGAANTAYVDSKKSLQEGFNKAREANKDLQFRDYVKSGEGQALFDAAKNQRSSVITAANDVGVAANKNVGNMANTEVAKNMAKKEVGIGQAIGNTWRSGAAGKAGLIAGGVGLLGMGALAAKGAFGSDGSQKEFSDDTEASLREAALIGGGLLTVGGATLAAKHGKLGFTKSQRAKSKEAYEKVAKKIKEAWNRPDNNNNKKEEVIKEAAKEATKETTAKTVKNLKFSREDWGKARKAAGSGATTEQIQAKALEMGFKPVK